MSETRTRKPRNTTEAVTLRVGVPCVLAGAGNSHWLKVHVEMTWARTRYDERYLRPTVRAVDCECRACGHYEANVAALSLVPKTGDGELTPSCVTAYTNTIRRLVAASADNMSGTIWDPIPTRYSLDPISQNLMSRVAESNHDLRLHREYRKDYELVEESLLYQAARRADKEAATITGIDETDIRFYIAEDHGYFKESSLTSRRITAQLSLGGVRIASITDGVWRIFADKIPVAATKVWGPLGEHCPICARYSEPRKVRAVLAPRRHAHTLIHKQSVYAAILNLLEKHSISRKLARSHDKPFADTQKMR